MKYKQLKEEQRRVRRTINRLNEWISECFSYDVGIWQTGRRFDVNKGVTEYEITFTRDGVGYPVWVKDTIFNEYICRALFVFIEMHCKDMHDKVDFENFALSDTCFLWDEYGYHIPTCRKCYATQHSQRRKRAFAGSGRGK